MKPERTPAIAAERYAIAFRQRHGILSLLVSYARRVHTPMWLVPERSDIHSRSSGAESTLAPAGAKRPDIATAFANGR